LRASQRFATHSNGDAAWCRLQPYAIALADRRLMALGGLWENWRSPAGERVRSFAIVTTPNELCAELHNRMRMVLGPETWPAWLGEEPAGARQLKGNRWRYRHHNNRLIPEPNDLSRPLITSQSHGSMERTPAGGAGFWGRRSAGGVAIDRLVIGNAGSARASIPGA
jgi:hypothetical protein